MDAELNSWITKLTGVKIRHVLDLMQLLWNLQEPNVEAKQRRGKLVINLSPKEYSHVISMKPRRDVLVWRFIPHESIKVVTKAPSFYDPDTFLPVHPPRLEKWIGLRCWPLQEDPVKHWQPEYTVTYAMSGMQAVYYGELAKEVFTRYG